ncbi:MAG: hypothetical protein WA277_05615 [Nitrospirota bacterium]
MGYSFRIFLIIAITQFILGCATLSPKQEGMITSEPTGASVWLYEITDRKLFIGTTPTNAWVKRGLLNGWFVAELSGYESERWLVPKQGPITHHFVLQKDISKYKEDERKHEEDERKQRAEITFDVMGITKGQYVWLKYPSAKLSWNAPTTTVDGQGELSGLERVKIKDFDVNDPYALLLFVETDEGKEVQINFWVETTNSYISYMKEAFYTKDPFPEVRKWNKGILDAIKKHSIVMGMTKEQVKLSWGLPIDINRSVGSWGVHEQWVYGRYSRTYLYFENGKLTSWQD